MEIKNQPLRRPMADGAAETAESLLKRRINNFLINYFGYLTLALSFIIFAAGLFLFVYPRYQQIAKEDEAMNKNLQTDYESKNSYLGAIRDLKNSYQLISGAERKKIEAMVPVGSKKIGLIPEIESMVLKNAAVLNSLKIDEDLKSRPKAESKVESGEKKKPPAGIFEQLPEGVGLAKIEINLSSVSYPVMKNLLKTVENNLRLLDIAKIDYDVQENKAIFIIYAYELEAKSSQPAASKIVNRQGIDLTIFSSEKFKELKENILIHQVSLGLGKRDPFKPN